jgi:hypothetical protein
VYRNIRTHIRTQSVHKFGPLEAFKSTETKKSLKISTVAYALNAISHTEDFLKVWGIYHEIIPLNLYKDLICVDTVSSKIRTLRVESGRAEQ